MGRRGAAGAMPRELTVQERFQRARERHVRTQAPDVTGRLYPAIDPGMAVFIMETMHCKPREVPVALEKWMRTRAIGTGRWCV